MEFQVPINIQPLPERISYKDKILLLGSCFTEHIGNALEELKFSVLQNPNGILFDPASVCKSLVSYVENRQYDIRDLFEWNEIWHSWQHHSRFSHTNKEEAIRIINESRQRAHTFLKDADWIIITLGSSFSYQLTELAGNRTGDGVANCHRAPAQWFNKHLLEINEIISGLDDCCRKLFQFNPVLKIIFTISPVRHIRDGVVENNRSKARLIEAVHHLVKSYSQIHYFPAYELVIDVLRDYRFYDIDLVHPNYPATAFVLEKFTGSCMDSSTRELMQEVKKIIIARKHRALQPLTNSHRHFLAAHLKKTKDLQLEYPFLDLNEELSYFSAI